jgi:exodeoxyribonuclease VII large subunit
MFEDNPGTQQIGLFEEKPLTVSAFIKLTNARLRTMAARIIGEIGRVDEKNGHRYFSLKDETDGSILNCIVWRSKYEMFGLNLKEGDKIIAAGRPEIYAASGKLSFICDSIEMAGEGALKKAYDALKKKLEAEGLFAVERKRKLPQFPRTIGIITSRQGAVINDFLTNIGKFGFRLELIDTRVEGQLAVGDILAALRTFRGRKIDVLVVIRGGGSPESLQAFNNEMIVREVASFPVPVIAGIGHDKDVPLVQMAADVSVSTPSIAAMQLNASWQKIIQYVGQQEISIIGRYKNELAQTRGRLAQYAGILSNFKYIIQNITESLVTKMQKMVFSLKSGIDGTQRRIEYLQSLISSHDPERPLKLGYCLASIKGKLIKNTAQAAVGDEIAVRLADGRLLSEVKKIET